MKALLLLLLLCSLRQFSLAQSKSTGIYLLVACNKYVVPQTVLVTGRSVCTTEKPILFDDSFETVSDILSYKDQVYFDITFTSKGYSTLTKLQSNFPYSEMALIVDGDVFIIFTMTERKLNRTFRFQGNRNEMALFTVVNARLQQRLKQ